MRFGAAGLLTAAALAFLSCDEGALPEPPVPGDLAVVLLSPNGPEGAAVLETTDGGILQITSVSGQTAHWRAGGATRIVVLLDAPGEIRFRLSVDNVRSPPEITIIEVADGDNRLRDDLSGYSVSVQPVTGA